MKSLILKIELLEIFAGTYMKTELLQFLNVQNLSEWRKQMGKKELIEKWKSKKGAPAYKLIESPLALTKREIYIAGYGVARKEILDDLKQLDEPKKVVIPQVVAGLNMLKNKAMDLCSRMIQYICLIQLTMALING